MNERIWRPCASLDALRFRAEKLALIRQFFSARNILEVDTPQLASSTVTDPHLDAYSVAVNAQGMWLQTSPEFHMKRLLAAGSGSIYQICKAYRVDELGTWHNPEFSMLEWYHLDFDHQDLMAELALLWAYLAEQPQASLPRHTYASVFEQHLALDVCRASEQEIQARVAQDIDVPAGLDRDALLDLAMSVLIAPHLGQEQPCFVYNYPASQSALARINEQGWASRFEMYWRGVELANGFHELADADEQRRRFQQDNQTRASKALALREPDQCLLDALAFGLPDCAGVAVGIDRLCSLLYAEDDVRTMMSFPVDRA